MTVHPPPRPGDPPVTVVAGPQYEAGACLRRLLSHHYRDVWTTSIRVPVLDPGSYRGGAPPGPRGGGFQTPSLHLSGTLELSDGLIDTLFHGGRRTLRGWAFHRLAGDAAVYGSAERRVPIGRLSLLTRGDVGVFALHHVGQARRGAKALPHL